MLKSRKGRSIAAKSEDDKVSSDVKKEEEPSGRFEFNRNEDEIFEITDETEVQEDDVDNKIEDNIDNENDDIEIIDDDLDDKDDFSIEIDDETDKGSEDIK